MLVPTVAAFDPQEPLFDSATAKVVLEFRLHEARQRSALLAQLCEETMRVPFDDGIQRRLFGPMASVARLHACGGTALGLLHSGLGRDHPWYCDLRTMR